MSNTSPALSVQAVALACLFLPTVLALSAQAQLPSADAVSYTLRFPAAASHYLEVDALIPTGGRDTVTVMMPVWTPGSYLVREYSRHIEALTASTPDGRALVITQQAKNRWTVANGGVARIRLTYRLYAREMSVRTNWVDADMAILNGAPTFITAVDAVARPHDVQLELPAGWTDVVTALPHGPQGPRHFVARDFDTLVDSPIMAGRDLVQHRFDVNGIPHVLANLNEAGVWDGPRSAADVKRIVDAHVKMWGSLPYSRYVFLNAITEGGGGLEHKDSTLLMTGRWRTRTPRAYRGWLGLVAHEFFHVWNVKRLRPVELGPFDYEQENYTPSLWISEGFTDYYGDLMVRRAGLITRDEYLDELSGLIRSLQTTPGRLTQSASASSFDAWIRQYRPDENSPNTTISYYTKGAVVAFVLDAHIRELTAGAKSLDDVMRAAYARYSGERGFTSEQFRALVGEVVGHDLSSWLAYHADGTQEIDYSPALSYFGLRFKPIDAKAPKAWMGATTKADGGRLVISQVRRQTPAFTAGLNVDDEILAIGEFRVRADQLDARLEHYRPGDTISLLVARRDQLMRLNVTLAADPTTSWALEVRSDATVEQQARLRAWLWQ